MAMTGQVQMPKANGRHPMSFFSPHRHRPAVDVEWDGVWRVCLKIRELPKLVVSHSFSLYNGREGGAMGVLSLLSKLFPLCRMF